ncbi:MAG: hypothetical protein CVT84_14415 [Alphaproteobacteria bacterium HGW-Alphaproteobacteria-6]|nr:MAG: hypothetical protein CVT84_14415 [Alphaproteobacteria bacterium HGW-Alphaproteobacteria-6]
MQDDRPDVPAHAAHAFAAGAIRVVAGANLGDAIGPASDCEPGDVYRLDPEARAVRLLMCPATGDGREQALAEGSGLGRAGDALCFTSLLTLMAPDGDRVELLHARHPASGASLALPLSPLVPRLDYTLLAASAETAGVRLGDTLCISFAAGTMITLPGGAQTAIEMLAPGDRVLTRDHGPQPLRWIGKATFRARGAFAPVVIGAGTLGNLGDLVVSPHHRIFIYQRGPRRLGSTAELLVQAKHLVDDDSVRRREGGFVDYYSLVFDRHEIIYAEGIPAESLMVNEATVGLLPPELAGEVKARFPGLSQSQHFGTEAGRELLDPAARQSLLNRGSGSGT